MNLKKIKEQFEEVLDQIMVDTTNNSIASERLVDLLKSKIVVLNASGFIDKEMSLIMDKNELEETVEEAKKKNAWTIAGMISKYQDVDNPLEACLSDEIYEDSSGGSYSVLKISSKLYLLKIED